MINEWMEWGTPFWDNHRWHDQVLTSWSSIQCCASFSLWGTWGQTERWLGHRGLVSLRNTVIVRTRWIGRRDEMRVWICMYIYICMYVCMYIYIMYIYIHTRIHMIQVEIWCATNVYVYIYIFHIYIHIESHQCLHNFPRSQEMWCSYFGGPARPFRATHCVFSGAETHHFPTQFDEYKQTIHNKAKSLELTLPLGARKRVVGYDGIYIYIYNKYLKQCWWFILIFF